MTGEETESAQSHDYVEGFVDGYREGFQDALAEAFDTMETFMGVTEDLLLADLDLRTGAVAPAPEGPPVAGGRLFLFDPASLAAEVE